MGSLTWAMIAKAAAEEHNEKKKNKSGGLKKLKRKYHTEERF